jgi:response regulator RpfG family c-di-GMP phosphodiesterase
MTETASQATLLFVDDEPSILSSLKRLFRPHGYRIHTAESGEEGLEILERESIDLVISDMRMPEMDGAAFLERVRQKWPLTVRILLTGYADIESTVNAINRGEIYRYINKPWDDHDIVLTVRDALHHKHLEQENQHLTSELRARNEELTTLNASLEDKVAARTADLQKAVKIIQSANAKLKYTFIATVQSFSGLVEMRSKSLSGHTRRVADHARMLARKMGLSEAEQQDVLFAALLHDIGKIGLPDAIIDKPLSALNPEDRAQLMQHPQRGETALQHIEQMKTAAGLIRHHHENWDGSGYPDRLTALAIPIGARIITVANDYDAMLIGTMTQHPMKPTDAIAYLIDNKGLRYDPQIVDLFVAELIEQLRDVIDEMPVRPLNLTAGMVLSRDIPHKDGYMLLSKGYTLDDNIISQLRRIEVTEGHPFTVFIRRQ